MNLMHIKLKSGIDLIAYVIENDSTHLTVKDPVQFGFDPNNGIYGIDWLLLSDMSVVKLAHSDVYFTHASSVKANQFYSEFTGKLSNMNRSDDLYTSDLETIYEAIIESRSNTKH